MTHYPFLDLYISCHYMSHYYITPIFDIYLLIVLLPIYYLLLTEWQWRPGGQLGNSYKSLSVSPTTLATYFLYIVYLIPIDLELSRSFNSPHCKAYIYLRVADISYTQGVYKSTGLSYRGPCGRVL